MGSHVADALSEAGHSVTVFDQSESPYLKVNQTMVVGNLMDQEMLEKLVSDFDVVYHFAGIADIDECAKRPVDTAKINILGTVFLLEACRKANVQRFVFASSAYVFSDSGFCYRSSKQACESFIQDYEKLFGLEYTCLRYGSLYGERADHRNSIYKLIRQAIEKSKICYSGNGDEIREFIHVQDAAKSSVKILEDEFRNKNVILTGSEKFTYLQLLEMIGEILGNKIEIEVVPSFRKAHYKISPYNFSPKLGVKLVNNPYIDMGQGLLQCMESLYREIHIEKQQSLGIFIDGK